jgi:tetratricopeptide (TPR) repeat protein
MKANMAYQDLAVEKFGMDDEIWDTYGALAVKHPNDPAFQVLFTRLQENNDGKIEQALGIVKRHPKNYWAQVLLGSAYEGYSNRDYTPEAIAAYEKAERIHPSEIEMPVKLAGLYRRVENVTAMKKAAQKAVAMDASRIDLLPRLWQSGYLSATNKDSAKKELATEIEKTIAAHGRDVEFLNTLLDTYLYGILDDARLDELAKQAVALDPKGQLAELTAMDGIWNEKDPASGARKAEAYLDSFPDSRHAPNAFRSWISFSKMRPGFNDEKVNAYADALFKENPRRTWIFESLFNHYSNYSGKGPDQTGKLEQIARSWLDACNGRKKAPVLNTLAGLYLKQNRTDEALRLLLQADTLCLKYKNPSADVAASLGDAYQKKGDSDLALDNYGRAVGLGAGDAVIEKCLAVYEKKSGSRDGAKKFINQKLFAQSALKTPYPAPDFTLGTATDDTIRMSDFKGKVVLVAIWNPG